MAMFNSYIKLPEGIPSIPIEVDGSGKKLRMEWERWILQCFTKMNLIWYKYKLMYFSCRIPAGVLVDEFHSVTLYVTNLLYPPVSSNMACWKIHD